MTNIVVDVLPTAPRECPFCQMSNYHNKCIVKSSPDFIVNCMLCESKQCDILTTHDRIRVNKKRHERDVEIDMLLQMRNDRGLTRDEMIKLIGLLVDKAHDTEE